MSPQVFSSALHEKVAASASISSCDLAGLPATTSAKFRTKASKAARLGDLWSGKKLQSKPKVLVVRNVEIYEKVAQLKPLIYSCETAKEARPTTV